VGDDGDSGTDKHSDAAVVPADDAPLRPSAFLEDAAAERLGVPPIGERDLIGQAEEDGENETVNRNIQTNSAMTQNEHAKENTAPNALRLSKSKEPLSIRTSPNRSGLGRQEGTKARKRKGVREIGKRAVLARDQH